MPIRHTAKGWFWGSKGPFKSRSKAESVARAAYANGYRSRGEAAAEGIRKVRKRSR